jgi:hypothetical protein
VIRQATYRQESWRPVSAHTGELVIAGRAPLGGTRLELQRWLDRFTAGSAHVGYAQWALRSMAVHAAGSNIHMITGSSHE